MKIKIFFALVLTLSTIKLNAQWNTVNDNSSFESTVHTNRSGNYGLNLESSGGNPDYLLINNLNGVNRQVFYFGHANNVKEIFGITSSKNSGQEWNKIFSINQNGNVGVGNILEDYKLTVDGSIYNQFIKFQNFERSYSDFKDENGILYFDENFKDNYSEIIGDGGGLSIKTEDGWGAIMATNNMRWITPTFDRGFYRNELAVGTDATTNQILFIRQQADEWNNGFRIQNSSNGQSSFMWMDQSNDLNIQNANNGSRDILFNATGSGKVGIGTNSPDDRLTVNGNIHATGIIRSTEVVVNTQASEIPDYVFKDDYDLMSLKEIETYIKEKSHLPEVPSAKEIEADGHNLSQMNLLLLKKIEELTLHTIEQEKKLRQQLEKVEMQQELVEGYEKKFIEQKELLIQQEKRIDKIEKLLTNEN